MGLSKSKSKKYEVASFQSKIERDGSTFGSIKSNSRRHYLDTLGKQHDIDIINQHESRRDKLIGVEAKPADVEKEIVDLVTRPWTVPPESRPKVARSSIQNENNNLSNLTDEEILNALPEVPAENPGEVQEIFEKLNGVRKETRVPPEVSKEPTEEVQEVVRHLKEEPKGVQKESEVPPENSNEAVEIVEIIDDLKDKPNGVKDESEVPPENSNVTIEILEIVEDLKEEPKELKRETQVSPQNSNEAIEILEILDDLKEEPEEDKNETEVRPENSKKTAETQEIVDDMMKEAPTETQVSSTHSIKPTEPQQIAEHFKGDPKQIQTETSLKAKDEEKPTKEILIEEFNSNLHEIEKERSDFVHEMLEKCESRDETKNEDLTENVNSIIHELETIATIQTNMLHGKLEDVNLLSLNVVSYQTHETSTKPPEENNNSGPQIGGVSKKLIQKEATPTPEEEIGAPLEQPRHPEMKRDVLDEEPEEFPPSRRSSSVKCDPLDEQAEELLSSRRDSSVKRDPLDEPVREPVETRNSNSHETLEVLDEDSKGVEEATQSLPNDPKESPLPPKTLLEEGERLTYIKQIKGIESDARKLREDVEGFEGRKDDVQFVYLNEMLLRCLLKLDSINVADEEVKQLRRKGVDYVQECVKVLDARSSDV